MTSTCHWTPKKIQPLLFFLTGPYLLSACFMGVTAEGSDHVVHALEGTQPYSIDIQTRNGSVEVREDSGISDLQVSAKYRAGASTLSKAEERLADIRLSIERGDDGVHHIRPSMPGGWQNRDSVSMVVLLPSLGNVRIETSNGRIHMEGGFGDSELISSNGSIETEGTRGELYIQTSNGKIRVADHEGGLSADSSNGSIALIMAPENQAAFDLDTSNGAVSVDLSPDWQGRIQASTSNGSMKHYVDDKLVSKSKGSMRVQLGSSGEESKISTSNGSVSIRE